MVSGAFFMITLYHAPRSRSSRIIFLLEELGAPYQLQIVSIRRRDGSGALDASNPHPHGKVPVIRDQDALVFESAAIALYLTDKFPEKGIGPLPGDALSDLARLLCRRDGARLGERFHEMAASARHCGVGWL
jgi:glutathione S-transferase